MKSFSTKKIQQFLLKEANILSIRAILQAQERAKVDRGEHFGKPYGFLHHRINKSILEVDYSASPTFKGAVIVPQNLLRLKDENGEIKSKIDESNFILAMKWDWNYTSLFLSKKRHVKFKEDNIKKRLWLLNYIYYYYVSKKIGNKDKLVDPSSRYFRSRYGIRNKNSQYETVIGFPKFEQIAKNIFENNKKYSENKDTKNFISHFHRELMKSDVALHCQCKAFKYYYSYAATKKGSSFLGMEQDIPAKTNNPSNYGIGCKHIHSILSGPISFSSVVKKCIEQTVSIDDGVLIIANNEILSVFDIGKDVYDIKSRKYNTQTELKNLDKSIDKLEKQIVKIDKAILASTNIDKIKSLKDKKIGLKYEIAEKKIKKHQLNLELDPQAASPDKPIISTKIFNKKQKEMMAQVNEPTQAPETSTQAPETPTQAPETSTQAPETSTQAPETPTQAPETSTQAPETSTQAPETSTHSPETPETGEASERVEVDPIDYSDLEDIM